MLDYVVKIKKKLLHIRIRYISILYGDDEWVENKLERTFFFDFLNISLLIKQEATFIILKKSIFSRILIIKISSLSCIFLGTFIFHLNVKHLER